MPYQPVDPAEVLDDPEVKVAVKGLVLETVRYAAYLMQHGDPQVKTSIMRSMLPTIAKGIRSEQADDALRELQEKFEALMAAVAAGNSIPAGRGRRADEVVEDTPE